MSAEFWTARELNLKLKSFFIEKKKLKLIFIYCCKILFIVVQLQQFYKLIASHIAV